MRRSRRNGHQRRTVLAAREIDVRDQHVLLVGRAREKLALRSRDEARAQELRALGLPVEGSGLDKADAICDDGLASRSRPRASAGS